MRTCCTEQVLVVCRENRNSDCGVYSMKNVRNKGMIWIRKRFQCCTSATVKHLQQINNIRYVFKIILHTVSDFACNTSIATDSALLETAISLSSQQEKNLQIFLSFSVSLFVEWEEFDVDATVGLIDGWRVPGHPAVVMQDSLESCRYQCYHLLAKYFGQYNGKVLC